MMAVSDIPFTSHMMETSKAPLHLGITNLVNKNVWQFWMLKIMIIVMKQCWENLSVKIMHRYRSQTTEYNKKIYNFYVGK